MNASSPARLSQKELSQLGQNNTALLLDVRSPAEFESVRIKGAINIPLDVLEERPDEIAARLSDTTILICHSGNRAGRAHDRLIGAGASAESLKILEGGVSAVQDADANLLVKGKQRWSLERQVRFTAGSIVLSSIVVSLRFPKARFVAGFVGSGLVYAGASDSCAMGKALMRLPYNKAAGNPSTDEVLERLPTQSS